MKLSENILGNRLEKGISLNFTNSDKLFGIITRLMNSKKYLINFEDNENDSGLKDVINSDDNLQKIASEFRETLKKLLEDFGKELKEEINNNEDLQSITRLTINDKTDIISDFVSYYSKINKFEPDFKNFLNYLYDKLYYNFSENICLPNDEQNILEYIIYCILFTYSRQKFIFFIQDNSNKFCLLSRINQFDFFQEIKNNIEKSCLYFK